MHDMKHLLIHIGYHRTGTTWLQRHLFNNTAAGFAGPFKRDGRTLELLVYRNALDFDPNECKNYFHPVILNIVNNGLIPVLSQERLSGNPHSGGYDSKELANRLVQVFPDGKVLIVIREQKNMILSTYQQYISRWDGPYSLKRYLESPRWKQLTTPSFHFDQFKYHRLIGLYISLFGKSNVLVLPYELFRSKPRDFVSEIIRFSGANTGPEIIANLPYSRKVNTSMPGIVAAAKRLLNPIVARSRNPLNPGVLFRTRGLSRFLVRSLEILSSLVPQSFQEGFDARSKTKIAEIVGDRYRQSNRCTAEMLSLNLEEYGYDM